VRKEMNAADIMVLIPAFNEEESIKSVIEETKHHLPEAHIVVVDDGSTDNTRKILEGIKDITALHHPFNVGIGGAIWTGLHYFLENNFDILLRIDADGQHPPSQAKNLLDPILQKKAETVIGSRFLEKRGYQSSLSRRGGIKLLDILSSFILKQKITDNTSGFKAYTRKSVKCIIEDFPFDYPEPIEVYLQAKNGIKIAEVPVIMRSRERGISSIKILDSYYYLLKVLLTILIKFFVGGKR
jgi:glycosyltransferase involved in cell wall biosynthesis